MEHVGGGHGAGASSVWVSSGSHEGFHDRGVFFKHGTSQWGLAPIISPIHLRAVGQEDLYQVNLPVVSRQHEQTITLLVNEVGI